MRAVPFLIILIIILSGCNVNMQNNPLLIAPTNENGTPLPAAETESLVATISPTITFTPVQQKKTQKICPIQRFLKSKYPNFSSDELLLVKQDNKIGTYNLKTGELQIQYHENGVFERAPIVNPKNKTFAYVTGKKGQRYLWVTKIRHGSS